MAGHPESRDPGRAGATSVESLHFHRVEQSGWVEAAERKFRLRGPNNTQLFPASNAWSLACTLLRAEVSFQG